MSRPNTARVTTPHQSNYPNPIKFDRGDDLVVGGWDKENPGWIWTKTGNGNEGWAPEQILAINGESAVAKEDYIATELTTKLGDILTVHRELAGWYWVTTKAGKNGWVPAETVISI